MPQVAKSHSTRTIALRGNQLGESGCCASALRKCARALREALHRARLRRALDRAVGLAPKVARPSKHGRAAHRAGLARARGVTGVTPLRPPGAGVRPEDQLTF